MSNHFKPRTPVRVARRKIDLTTPWNPLDSRGKSLVVFEEYDALVRDNPAPTHLDKYWKKLTLDSLLDAHPKSGEAIWDSIVAIWRLEKLFMHAYKEIWGHHTIAWLHRHADLCEVIGILPIEEVAGFARTAEENGNIKLHLLPPEYTVTPMSSRETTPEVEEEDSNYDLLSARPTANTQELASMRLDAGSSSKRLLEEDSGGSEAPIKRSRIVRRLKVVESSDGDECLITLPDLREFEGSLSRPGQTVIGLSQALGNLQAARQRSQSDLQLAQDLVKCRDKLAESLVERMEEEIARMRREDS